MQMIRVCFANCYPLDKRRKLNVHNTLRGYPECFLGCCSKYVAISGLLFPADLVTFTEEILNGKVHLLCSVYWCIFQQLSTFFSLLCLMLIKAFSSKTFVRSFS